MNEDHDPMPVDIEEETLDILQELRTIVFKLRSHSDPVGGEYSFGFESGLEMAAMMVDNLISRIGDIRGS